MGDARVVNCALNIMYLHMHVHVHARVFEPGYIQYYILSVLS